MYTLLIHVKTVKTVLTSSFQITFHLFIISLKALSIIFIYSNTIQFNVLHEHTMYPNPFYVSSHSINFAKNSSLSRAMPLCN